MPPTSDLAAQIDAAEQLEAVTRRLIPLVGPTLEHMYKLQLREQLRHAVVNVEARGGGRAPGVDEVAVAFADLVGFTRLGEELPPEEFGEITQRFSGLASEATSGPVRLVKMIGDAAMFSSPDPAALADTVLELLDLVAEQDDELPGVRAGMSWGPAVSRAGDFYGRPVNLASRLTGVARPGSLLVAADDLTRSRTPSSSPTRATSGSRASTAPSTCTASATGTRRDEDGGRRRAARSGERDGEARGGQRRAARTSAAALSPERTAPSMKPAQREAVSVPAQWIGPTGSASAGPTSIQAPSFIRNVGPPALHGSAAQSCSK